MQGLRYIIDYVIAAAARHVGTITVAFMVMTILLFIRLITFVPDVPVVTGEPPPIYRAKGSPNTDLGLVYRDSNIIAVPFSYDIGSPSDYTSRDLHLTGDMKFSALNRKIYEIADKYIKRAENLPYEYRDPLILGAIANIEMSVYTDFNKLYIAAIPTVGIEDFTADIIDTYGAEETMNNDEYWNLLLPYSALHQGPFQMGIDYGINIAVEPSELHGTEFNERLPERYARKYSVPESWYISSYPNGGDRYNWADACNRMSGVLNTWITYNPNIRNKYEFLALSGIAHNTGPSVFIKSNSFNPLVAYFPWNDVGDARSYVKAITTEENLSKLREVAKEDVKKWQAGLKKNPDDGRGFSWGYAYIQDMNISQYYTLKGDYTNRLSYPLRVVYYYFLLEEMYTGGVS